MCDARAPAERAAGRRSWPRLRESTVNALLATVAPYRPWPLRGGVRHRAGRVPAPSVAPRRAAAHRAEGRRQGRRAGHQGPRGPEQRQRSSTSSSTTTSCSPTATARSKLSGVTREAAAAREPRLHRQGTRGERVGNNQESMALKGAVELDAERRPGRAHRAGVLRQERGDRARARAPSRSREGRTSGTSIGMTYDQRARRSRRCSTGRSSTSRPTSRARARRTSSRASPRSPGATSSSTSRRA